MKNATLLITILFSILCVTPAIAFGAKPNFSFTNILTVSDFNIGVNIGLTYDRKNKTHPVVVAARDFATSTEWLDGLLFLGLLPAE